MVEEDGPRGSGADLLTEIEDICRLLVSETTVDELAVRLGAVRHRANEGQRLVVTPADPRFEEARVTSGRRDGVPTQVGLRLSESGRPTVASLRDRFGPYRIGVRLHFEDDHHLLFSLDVDPTAPATCTLIASVYGTVPADAVEEAEVTSVDLRRDPR